MTPVWYHVRDLAAGRAFYTNKLGFTETYVDSDGNPVTPLDVQRRRFGDQEIRSRRSHVEDWIALLVANHLFAACDAYVSASLWDVPAHVTVKADRGRMQLLARISW